MTILNGGYMKDDLLKVEILPGVSFSTVFNFQDWEAVFCWSSPTSLKNITWDTWLTFRLRWPFIKLVCFFIDIENNLFYPAEGSWLDKQIKKDNLTK